MKQAFITQQVEVQVLERLHIYTYKIKTYTPLPNVKKKSTCQLISTHDVRITVSSILLNKT